MVEPSPPGGLLNNKPGRVESNQTDRVQSTTHQRGSGYKKKHSKKSSQSKVKAPESSEPQQGVLGYMSHHRWGKTEGMPVKLETLPLECRQWVVKLSPILDMFDYDCQDILDLVERCSYDATRIESMVDAIFTERAGHERGPWQPGRRSNGVQNHKSSGSTAGEPPCHDKPGNPAPQDSQGEKSHNSAPNKKFRNKKNVGQGTKQVKRVLNTNTSGPFQNKPQKDTPVTTCSEKVTEESTSSANVHLSSQNGSLSFDDSKKKEDEPSKTSWVGIVLANLSGAKGKDTQPEKEPGSAPIAHDSKVEGPHREANQAKYQEYEHHVLLHEDTTTVHEQHVYRTTEIRDTPEICPGLHTSLDGQKTVDETRDKASPPPEHTSDVEHESQKANVSLSETVTFITSDVRKEVPPGLCPASGNLQVVSEKQKVAIPLPDIAGLVTAPVGEPKDTLSRAEQVPLNENLNFYLGGVRRTPSFTLLSDKVATGANEPCGGHALHQEKIDTDQLAFDPLRHYREDSLYEQRRMPYPNHAAWQHVAFKEAQLSHHGLPRGVHPTLLYSAHEANGLGYSRDGNRRVVDGAVEMRHLPDVYDASSVYPPMHPSYVAPFPLQQHRAMGINSMSRYPIQYHPYGTSASRPGNFYSYHIDRSMMESQTPHYPLEPKQGNISIFPYNMNNPMMPTVDYRASQTRAVVSPTTPDAGGLNDVASTDPHPRHAYEGCRLPLSRQGGVQVYAGMPGASSTSSYASLGPPPTTLHAVPTMESRDLGPSAQESLRWRSQGATPFDPSMVHMSYPGFHIEKQYDPSCMVPYDHPSLCYDNSSPVVVTSSTHNAHPALETVDMNVTNQDNHHHRDAPGPQNFVPGPVSNYFVDRPSSLTHGIVSTTSGRNHMMGVSRNVEPRYPPVYRNTPQATPFSVYHEPSSTTDSLTSHHDAL